MEKMSATMAIQPKISFFLKPSQFTSKTLSFTTLKPQPKPKPSFNAAPKLLQTTSRLNLSASPAEPILSDEGTPTNNEKLGVVVKPMERPRVVLKMIWMEKAIGVAIDQGIPGFGTIPLSPYYFWPMEDAWEHLKMLLETKPWISRKQMHILLNQATDIINLWQQTRADS